MIFGSLSNSQFLTQCWQKRPLLVRGAFSPFRDPVTPNELAGLALEEDIDSRLVIERGGTHPWQVVLGPQKSGRLRKLPRSHWTLLVQGVDRYIPGVAALLDPFRFIPAWRVEDVMVSFAPRGGTVGPHLDSYDVFLIQGKGRRRWRIDKHARPDLKPGLDLRILKSFHATQDWILEPGDMLYLPPGLAHYGTALEDCLTYSVGFRAPSGVDLLVAAQELISQGGTGLRYSDPNLTPAQAPGEIPRTALRRFRRLLTSTLEGLTEAEFDTIVGGLLTEPKGAPVEKRSALVPAALRSRVLNGTALLRTSGTRMAFLRRPHETDLFVNGTCFRLSKTTAPAARLLTHPRRLHPDALRPHLNNPEFISLLAQLVNAGAFEFETRTL